MKTTKNNKNSRKMSKKLPTRPDDFDPDFIDDDELDNDMDMHEFRKFLGKIFPSSDLSNKIEAGETAKKAVSSVSGKSANVNSKSESKKQKNKKRTSKNDSSDDMEDSSENIVLTVSSPSKNKVSISNSKVPKEKETESEKGSETGKKSGKGKRGKSEVESGLDMNNLNIFFTYPIGEEGEDDDYEEYEYDSDYDEFGSEFDWSEEEDEDVSVSSVSDSSDEYEEEESESDENDEIEIEFDNGEDYQEEEEVEIPTRRSKRIQKKKSKAGKSQLEPGEIEEIKEASEPKEPKEPKGPKGLLNQSKKNKEAKEAKEAKSGKKNPENQFENKSTEEVLAILKQLREGNTSDKALCESMDLGIEHYEAKKEKSEKLKTKKEEKQTDKNGRIFKRLLRDKNSNNDASFFAKLDKEKQVRLIKQLREVNKISKIDTPYRIALIESDMPEKYKSVALKKLNALKYMEPGSGEFYKIKTWVDTFMRIPFNDIRKLPLHIDDGVEKCHDFMETAQKTLDDAVYGLSDAKMQIMQLLGQLITNPMAIGTSIAIQGPMGTGKTTLVKEGISKILDRPFAFIALGGATDSSFLEGHSYTYEGSMWGKIVQIIIDSKCMNPVIYFDELDKISGTPKGEEIAGILTHLTDTAQNTQFHDKYFSEVDFDLSKCLFIFSYNDESKVNPILRDRMYRIHTKGYNGKEKTVISNNHVMPKIREQVKFTQEDVIVPDETIGYIIENYCDKEQGVRNLKRCLEIIYTKLNLFRLMKPGNNLFQSEMNMDVKFPFTVTKEAVDKFIKRDDKSMSIAHMYI